MTKNEILRLVNAYRGGGREFSQELPVIVEAILDTIGDLPDPVQADWNETTTTSLAYINNKPTPYVVTPTTGEVTAEVATATLAKLDAGAIVYVVDSGKKYTIFGYDSTTPAFYYTDSTGTVKTVTVAAEEEPAAEETPAGE